MAGMLINITFPCKVCGRKDAEITNQQVAEGELSTICRADYRCLGCGITGRLGIDLYPAEDADDTGLEFRPWPSGVRSFGA